MLLEQEEAGLQSKGGSGGRICEQGLVLVSWLQRKRGKP